MPRLVINSVAELKAIQAKFKILKSVLPTLNNQSIDAVANDQVLDEIHNKMRLNDFSDKIIDATFVGKTEKIGKSILRTHFISDYVADNGFDVSNAREEGTANGVLRRPKKEGGVLRWIGQGGQPIFRKFSRPKGMERLLIIEKTLAKAQNEAVTNFQGIRSSFVSKFLGV